MQQDQDKEIEQAAVLKSAVLCERILQDVRTRRFTLESIFETISRKKFPVRIEKWMLYIELTEIRRPISVKIEVLRVTGELLGDTEFEVRSQDALEIIQYPVSLPPVTALQEGVCLVKIFANNKLVGDRRVIFSKIKNGL